MDSFRGFLYGEIRGGQQAVELSTLFGTVDAAILITDAGGVINYVNPGFEKLTGFQVVQVLGQETGRFPAPWNGFVQNKSADNREGTMDVIWDRAGRKKYVNWQLSPLREEGTLLGWLIIARDRTDYYYWQQAVEQAEQLASTSALVGSLAHELRNPLSALKGMLQLMGRKRDQDCTRGYIDLSICELDRVTKVLNEFVLLGKPAEKPDTPISLVEFFRKLMPVLQNEGELYGIELVLDVQSEPRVQADSCQLTHVVADLVKNAVEATENSGPVVISLFQKEDRACISVRDHGPGIPEKIRDKIFRPFFTTKERGTGLSLAVSQAIVHNHGGDLSFRNEPGGGAVFNVVLPLYDAKNPHRTVDIIASITDRFIDHPVIRSLMAAGFKVLSAREDQMPDLIRRYRPSVCLVEGGAGQSDLVRRIKQENTAVTVMVLGPVDQEITDQVVRLPLPVNYAQLVSKIRRCTKQ